jgi:hypothetical protein
MTVNSSSSSSRDLAKTWELHFMERGAVVHEFLLLAPGSRRPQRYGYIQLGELQDKAEADEFIDYCERGKRGRIRNSWVLFAWANWKQYERPLRASRAR